MPTINHVHKYVRFKGKPGYYKCDSFDCTFYIERELIVNKLTRCSKCEDVFVLTREDLKRARPKCSNCSKSKKAKEDRLLQDLTRDLGTSPEFLPGIPKEEYIPQEEEEETQESFFHDRRRDQNS